MANRPLYFVVDDFGVKMNGWDWTIGTEGILGPVGSLLGFKTLYSYMEAFRRGPWLYVIVRTVLY